MASKKTAAPTVEAEADAELRLVTNNGVKRFMQAEFKDAEGEPEYRVAGDLAEALQPKVESLLKDAAARAKSNGRTTIRPEDL